MRKRSDLLLGSLTPLVMWFACLSLLYGAATLACETDVPPTPSWYIQLLIWTITIVALGAMFALSRKFAHPFPRTVSLGVSLLAITGTLWLLAPILILGPCR
jgi:hypothetical protein